MQLVARTKAEQNQAVLDPWTAVHTAMGLAAGLINMRFGPAMLGAVAYEVIEHAFETSETGQNLFAVSGPEHAANAVVDVLVFGVGWWLGRKWNRTS